MDADTMYIAYLAVIRLATIAVGLAGIRYGYKLFAAGVFKADVDALSTEVTGRAGEYEFTFKTAAPGSVLALFGAAVIVATMAAAPPGRTREARTVDEDRLAGTTRTSETKEVLRGEGADFATRVEEARRFREAGQTASAIRAYERAVGLATEPIHELATLYLQVPRLKDARDLAEVALMMSPSNPDFQITLSSWGC
jgi:hypothetical protein